VKYRINSSKMQHFGIMGDAKFHVDQLHLTEISVAGQRNKKTHQYSKINTLSYSVWRVKITHVAYRNSNCVVDAATVA